MISAETLHRWLHDGDEIAVFDVREHGQYGEGHLFYAVSLPYSVLERDVFRLAPKRAVRLVVYGDEQELVLRAADRLATVGYTNVHCLTGGVAAWLAYGQMLFKGVNLPSKAFGELVETHYHTPRLSAAELAAKQAAGEKLVVLDGRPFTEYQKMSIPGAICCPNGELGYRIDDLVDDDSTTIVINCAGRTRSIMGAQTLINLAIRNPVFALENGTQGWFLADLPLQHGQQRRYPASGQKGEGRIAAATALAERTGVMWVDAAQVGRWWQDPLRSVFLCDVRTHEEFCTGSLPGAQHTPGGQLQQALDLYVGVRHATLVLIDDDNIRAPLTASWLRQLGHQAYVLIGGVRSGLSVNVSQPHYPAPLPLVSVAELAAELLAGTVEVIELRDSQAFRKAHIAGSRWAIRPHLAAVIASALQPVVLVSDDPHIAAWAIADLPPSLQAGIRALDGGFSAWRAAGLPSISTPALPADAQCIDYLFFTHDRHDGNKVAARQYLDWELALLGQLNAQELAAFRLPDVAAHVS
ncbi:rhodanese-like domain-containing protein [Glaciimonas sp. PCH181]|uniref:rhodanese-like domain-containing protein n=1 Tax=Glaciimonas sp. PCH181 TaxID=2133943 RepID=UPI000D3866F0|nr:rhodanese-like domain-containing protein [Glaciimonas sp. PCH181]PUA18703.1 sulfurtransferase [Glaciimonas sp. PCH181]